MQTPKHNEEIEAQIIGGIIKDSKNQSIRESFDLLSPEDFYSSVYRNIFNEAKLMVEEKIDVNVVTLDSRLTDKKINSMGFFFLAEKQKAFVSMSAVSGYVKELKRLSGLRSMQNLSVTLQNMISENCELGEISEHIESSVKKASVADSGVAVNHINDAASNYLDLLDRRQATKSGILGVSTGFNRLDEALAGFDEESLIVVAGAPSMGKTLFTQALCKNISINDKHNTMFFSMEMSETQLYERFISGLSNMRPQDLRLARFNDEEYGRISNAISELDSSGLYYTDEQGLSVAQIRAKVRRHIAKKGKVKMIVIDYLGLIKLNKADRHDIAVGEVTRSLKELAKEIKAPIVLVAQANRTTTRPNMRSLKDSSCIEADADVIMFVHRHEILEPETELKGITELIISKDRHNDGNGTIYMEKVNGGFSELSVEQAATMVEREKLRLNPPKENKKMGFGG